jgi:siroheme synthase-like protein
VVIGGDGPAEPKIRGLLDAGARVTMIAETTTPLVEDWLEQGLLAHRARAYQRGDLAGAVIAYASTRDAGLIARLQAEASREHVLLNVIDVPAACAFISPAVVRRGDLTIAIGTGGASPALSARLRAQLKQSFGTEYGPYVAILGAIRAALWDRPDRTATVTALVDSSTLLDLVRAGDRSGIDALLAAVTGTDHTLERLGVSLEGEA